MPGLPRMVGGRARVFEVESLLGVAAAKVAHFLLYVSLSLVDGALVELHVGQPEGAVGAGVAFELLVDEGGGRHGGAAHAHEVRAADHDGSFIYV